MSIAYPLLLAFPAAMIMAALSDLTTMTIPNRISLLLLVSFVVLAPLAGLPLEQILIHLGIGFAVLVFGMVLFATGTFGGGDAKLLAAGALWMGAGEVLPFVTYVAIFGGVLALLMLAYRRFPVSMFPMPIPAWAERLHQRDCGIPYGIAIAAAALIAFPATGLYALIVS